MSEAPDWSLATWEGNRRRQHLDFQALSFREKLQVIENLGEVTDFFAQRARARAARARETTSPHDANAADPAR